MEVEIRQAALCLIRRGDAFLVVEIKDRSGVILHRPPGGGVEANETAEGAVRRELHEELGVTLRGVEQLGAVDHTWFWNGREVRERAWLFLANSDCDERLSAGECPELVEADGQRFRTLWRGPGAGEMLPPLCPSELESLFRDHLAVDRCDR